jgi:hypothetical protein
MVRMVFMLAAVHDLELDQIDVWAAYLNAEIDVPIYIHETAKGLHKRGPRVQTQQSSLWN